MVMNKIGLLVGEDTDLPKYIIENLPVSIFLYSVNWPSLSEGSSFYKLMRSNAKDYPTTSQPSIQTFKNLFESNLEKYQDLIVITIASHVSGTYNAAIQAKKLLSEQRQRRIHVIDSQSASGAEALLTLKAAELISSHKGLGEIIDTLKKIAPSIHFLGVFDDPRWLQKGGRINKVQALLVQNMLKNGFRPILTIRDGQIVTKKIQMNAKNKAEAMFRQFTEEIKTSNESAKRITMVITYSDCEEQANLLKKKVEDFNKSVSVKFINIISPVIGAHLGPDALLLAWVAE